MGYTHYWDQLRDFTDDEWDQIKSASNRFIGLAQDEGIEIRGPMGVGQPRVNNQLISLNGNAEEDLDHESFIIYKKKQAEAWDFCKTARKPYDIVVTSILAYARKVAPNAIEISSDGGEAAFKEVYAKRKRF